MDSTEFSTQLPEIPSSSSSPEGTPPVPEDTLVYLVDDEPATVKALGRFIESLGYELESFTDPIHARARIEERPPDLLLTDKTMPALDGLELTEAALGADPDTAVIIFTGSDDVEAAAESLRLGVSDYLLKPVDLERLEKALTQTLWARTLRVYRRNTEHWLREEVRARTQEVAEQKRQLEDLTVTALSTLVRALEAKSEYFKGHSEAVARLSHELARQMGLPADEAEVCRAAGYLHDIGMIVVPDRIIDKDGPLTGPEFQKVKEHCRAGEEILRPFSHLGPVSEFVLHHHERLDGSGYPAGLRGDAIPQGAQIVGLADVYCALLEERPYRPASSSREALETLTGTEGIWFSRRALSALESAVSAQAD
jgi:putative nucleotidyltransferase with HDIG domain